MSNVNNEYIDKEENKEINKEEYKEENNTFNSWEDLNIKTDLLRGIYAIGFETPSPIQRKAIIPMIKGRDIIAQAQSGTGKTGCFTIASLQFIAGVREDQVQIQLARLAAGGTVTVQPDNSIITITKIA